MTRRYDISMSCEFTDREWVGLHQEQLTTGLGRDWLAFWLGLRSDCRREAKP